MNQPTNAYLDADNLGLSNGCKNEPSDAMKNGGVQRVCYYKTVTKGTYQSGQFNGQGFNGQGLGNHYPKYTVSMYRLELQANAYPDYRKIFYEVRLTSSVTFELYTNEPADQALKRVDKVALRPTISVNVKNGNLVNAYQITDGFAPYSEVYPDSSGVKTIVNTLQCVGSIVAVFVTKGTSGKVFATADGVSPCYEVWRDIVTQTSDHGYAQAKPTEAIANSNPTIISPVRLLNSNNFIAGWFQFRDDVKDASNLTINVNFVNW